MLADGGIRIGERRSSRRHPIDSAALALVLARNPFKESAHGAEYEPSGLARKPYSGLPYSN